MFISVFNHLCLKDCHPPEQQRCWNGSRLVKLLVFSLLGKTFGQFFFVCVSFVSFINRSNLCRNKCVIACAKRKRPPLVASQYSFAGLIRRTPPPTFSDTVITGRHSDTTISSSELTGCGYPGLLDRKNRSDLYHRWESNPRLPA